MHEGREYHPKNLMEGKHKIAITFIERENTQERGMKQENSEDNLKGEKE